MLQSVITEGQHLTGMLDVDVEGHFIYTHRKEYVLSVLIRIYTKCPECELCRVWMEKFSEKEM